MVKQIDIPLEIIDFSDEHLKWLKTQNMVMVKYESLYWLPCYDDETLWSATGKISCGLYNNRRSIKSKTYVSNRSALDIVKNESGIGRKILRPLSAKNLNPTEMELDGLIDRDVLMDIKGELEKSKWT